MLRLNSMLRKRQSFGYGYGFGGETPIVQGDFIWYELSDEKGFLNDNGVRKINDEGNTIMVGASGTHDGTMYSGRSVTVSGDGVIPVPINYDGSTVQGSVTYFDGTAKEFIQDTNLPLSPTYDLKDGTYGSIISLGNNVFSSDDIAAFNSKPELVIQWALGQIDIPSGITKQIDDKVWSTTEGIDAILHEIGKVPEDTITIEGTYSWNERVNYGLQLMRCELDVDNVPTDVITNHQIRFHGKGDYVDTGVAIDGSQSDFTMMLGFTLPEVQAKQHLVRGKNIPNQLELYAHDTWNINELQAGIGQFSQIMTFDINNPIHAMVAVFNSTTSQLQVAIDGEPLSAPFDIVFDGVTGTVLFGVGDTYGNTPVTGYISEGILSATMESEDAWFTFWRRVQLGQCDKTKPVGEYLSNYSFDCGTLGWDFDPAYPATITDNGDGSLHLKTDSNFGSLVPANQTFDAADWVIEVKFRNQVGNGKISFRRPNNTWVSTPTIGDGVHQSNPFSGAIKEIHVGADGDPTYEADYEYISLKKKYTDIVPPVITILGDNPLNHEVNTPYSDPGATAQDNVDGDITSEIVTVNNVDENTEGSYTVTYNVSDTAGNVATEQVRDVNVIAADTPPSQITDFNASDDQVLQITYTWSDAAGTPTISYNLYNDNDTLIKNNVTSPHIETLSVAITDNYYIKAINSIGETDSNMDEGTSLPSSNEWDERTDVTLSTLATEIQNITQDTKFIIADETYTSALTIENNPHKVWITAANPLGVVMQNTFTVNTSDTIIEGLLFNGWTEDSNNAFGIDLDAPNCKITKCRWDNFKGRTWIHSRLNAHELEISYCDFLNMDIDDGTVGETHILFCKCDRDGTVSTTPQNTHIHHNYFYNGNPLQAIKIYYDEYSTENPGANYISNTENSVVNGAVFEYNLIDGIAEAISNKQRGITTRFNTIINTSNAIVERLGGDGYVYGNTITVNSTYGLGISVNTPRCLFYNNDITMAGESTGGNNYGIVFKANDGAGDFYAGVTDCVVAFNTVRDSGDKGCIAFLNGNGDDEVPSTNVLVANNIALPAPNGLVTYNGYSGAMDLTGFTFAQNIYQGTLGDVPPEGFDNNDPQITQDTDGRSVPSSGSYCLGKATTDASNVTTDIYEQTRPDPRAVGSSEIVVENNNPVLTPSDVGVGA